MGRRRGGRRSSVVLDAPVLTPRPTLAHIALVDDRRLFHPDPYRAPVAYGFPKRVRFTIPLPAPYKKARKFVNRIPSLIGFDAPQRVIRCIRRKVRKEVMFATKSTGKGSRAPKRRNYWSDVKC